MLLQAWFTGVTPGADPFLILLAALAVDAAFGDPAWLYRLVSHPTVIFGRCIDAGERWLYKSGATSAAQRLRGGLLTLIVVIGAAGTGLVISLVLARVPGGWIVEAIVASSLIAYRGLYDHVKAVGRGLDQGLAEGRVAVGHIVGRDPETLDAPAVARAAVESLAENFSDGVLAPAFWYLLLGLPGLYAYKALNTADSMIGQRTARYEAFGTAAARLDDGANFLPARLAGALLVAAAAIMPGADASRAWRAMVRDAPKHRSPNAGWQEAAVAGALGLALAGPRVYGGETAEDHWMGDGTAALTTADIDRALKLYIAAGGLLAALIALGWLV
jgi:adenosylcobinamide-phosphate synthase